MLLIINLYVASINSRSVSEACILLPSYIPFWGHRCNLEQQGYVASGLGRKWLLQGWQGETGAGGCSQARNQDEGNIKTTDIRVHRNLMQT